MKNWVAEGIASNVNDFSEKSLVENSGVENILQPVLWVKEREKSWIYITYFRKTNGLFQTTKVTNV